MDFRQFLVSVPLAGLLLSTPVHGSLIPHQVHVMNHYRRGQIPRPTGISIQFSLYPHPFFLEQEGEDL